jgi:predicted ATP-binding protein involved in virulence
MTEEELKQKCKERAKIFQQAMESCKSSSPIDCIEWFADRIAELEKENAELKGLKDVATLIRANNDTVTTLMQLNNMLVSKTQQLTKAKEIIKELLSSCFGYNSKTVNYEIKAEAEQFLSEVEK